MTAVFVSMLNNRLSTTVAEQVPAAVTAAGLPADSVSSFLTALTGGQAEAFTDVPGISDAIIGAGSLAYKQANIDAYRTVYFTTIAFSGLGLILAVFAPNTKI